VEAANKPSRIKVLLVDDHPIVLEGLKHVMRRSARLQIVGVAHDGAEAINQAQTLQPDVILMDIAMPGTDGIEATRVLAQTQPGVRVLGLSVHDSPYYVREMSDAGASGYIVKTTPPEEMIRIIERVHAGERWFEPAEAEGDEAPSSGQHKRPLSRRELEVLRLIADGYSNKLIAERLGISVRTVETHRERIMRKLEVQGTAGLTKWAVVHGLVDPAG
jgi:DNA-binding NarL/FixJ family response regulator